jgi:probable addiction module antidote protein
MALKTLPFDPSEYIDTPEAAAEYLAAAFESGDASVISDALGVIARAKGMTQLAKETGLSRQSLYRSLSADGHPEISTVLKVLHAIGVTLTPTPMTGPL